MKAVCIEVGLGVGVEMRRGESGPVCRTLPYQKGDRKVVEEEEERGGGSEGEGEVEGRGGEGKVKGKARWRGGEREVEE